MNVNTQQIVSITVDSGANLKLLKTLEREGYIAITSVNVENGKKNKTKQKIGPVGVLDLSEWDDGSVFGAEDNLYNEALSILGKQNTQDARLLEAHIRSGNDVFVSEDKNDVLNNASEIRQVLGVTVMSSNELHSLIVSKLENGHEKLHNSGI